MTTTPDDALRAALKLLPWLTRITSDAAKGSQIVQISPEHGRSIIAALEAAASQPVADGRRCKMAWAQGFCYGDPEYYPPASPVIPVDRREVLEEVALKCDDNARQLRRIVEKLKANGEHAMSECSKIRAEQTEGIAEAIRSLASSPPAAAKQEVEPKP